MVMEISQITQKLPHAIELYQQGTSLTDTATQTGLCHETLRKYLILAKVYRPKQFKHHCPDCGVAMPRYSGSAPNRERCRKCAAIHREATKKYGGN